jgi:anti-anti-sigma factor
MLEGIGLELNSGYILCRSKTKQRCRRRGSMETRSTDENHTIVRLDNCAEIAQVIEFRSLCSSLTDSKVKGIIVDLQNVKIINSLGLGAFLSVQRKMRTAGGSFALMNIPDELSNTFSLDSINGVFTIYKTEEDFHSAIGRKDTRSSRSC